MHDDISQGRIDHDPLRAARLKQHPESSSFDLTDYLIAETGLHWPTAMRIVDDYTFRKVLDTSQADWKAVRPFLLRLLQGGLWVVPTLGLCRLMKQFLPPLMRSVMYSLVLVLSFAVILLMTARDRSATPSEGVPDRRSGGKQVKFA